MRRSLQLALAVMALVLFPFCGMREPGLEVELDIASRAAGASGVLEVARVELLACPDAPRSASWRELLPAVAHAHDTTTAQGGWLVSLPDARAAIVVAVLPGTYCDVRLHLGDAARPALVVATGSAVQRDVVLRIVDEEGTPRPLALALAPDRARVTIDLGTFEAHDAPEHALSQVFDGASARLTP